MDLALSMWGRKCVVLLFVFPTEVAQGFVICRCEGGFHPCVDPSIGVTRQLSPLAVCVANCLVYGGYVSRNVLFAPQNALVVIELIYLTHIGNFPVEMPILRHSPCVETGLK